MTLVEIIMQYSPAVCRTEAQCCRRVVRVKGSIYLMMLERMMMSHSVSEEGLIDETRAPPAGTAPHRSPLSGHVLLSNIWEELRQEK